ncbi:hypothetical protein [Paenibacillus sanguinis]|uniref:hypothetical protein n=1 Tax=Paenibacillus sanguinis TaxID=225906 RepID=UPI00036442A5|nr:hypothetical protein [Paenibacillus sanguinis]
MTDARVLINYVDGIWKAVVEVPAKYEANLRQMEELEKESNDLLHALELLDISPEKAAEYAVNIRNNRLERRRFKDENMILKPLYDYIKQHRQLESEIRLCQQSTVRACGVLKDRCYRPRVRTDLTELFRKAKEAQHG